MLCGAERAWAAWDRTACSAAGETDSTPSWATAFRSGRGSSERPGSGLRTSEYGRDYRVGYGMQVLEQGKLNLELGIDAERRESPVFHLQEGSAGTDQRVLGRATVQW